MRLVRAIFAMCSKTYGQYVFQACFVLHLPAQHDVPNQDNHGYEHVRKLYSSTQTESLMLNQG